MVIWSREWESSHGKDPEMVYHCHAIKDIDVFPQWAIKATWDEYQINGAFKKFNQTEYVSMHFNETLVKIKNQQTPSSTVEERKSLLESFPPPSKDWVSILNVLYYSSTQPISSTARMMSMGTASTHPTPEIPEPEVKKDVKIEEKKKSSASTLSTPQADHREDKSKDKGDEPKNRFTPTGM